MRKKRSDALPENLRQKNRIDASRRWRTRHPEKRKSVTAAWRQRNRQYVTKESRERRARLLSIVRAAKSRACADCGQTLPPCCMDFDHRPGTQKHPRLSYTGRKVPMSMSSLGLSSPAAFQREVEKCDLVCANCHRIRTWNRRHGGDHKLDENKV